MAKQYVVEYWTSEGELQDFLNDPACEGMRPVSIYPTPGLPGDSLTVPVTVWWDVEDSDLTNNGE